MLRAICDSYSVMSAYTCTRSPGGAAYTVAGVASIGFSEVSKN